MLYDNELTLIEQTYDPAVTDAIGNQIPQETETTILCCLKSITRSEFYAAATAGLKPALVFTVHKFEYDEQAEVEYENVRYKVIRTYAVNTEELELTCEEVIAI